MRVAFSVSSKAQSGKTRPTHFPTPDEHPSGGDEAFDFNREHITEFDSSESPADSSRIPKPLVIPPKPNEWNPQKRPNNHPLPHLSHSETQALQFDVDSTSVDAVAGPVAYGLNLRDKDNAHHVDNSVQLDVSPVPGVDPTLQKLREDLKKLPDSVGIDEYEEVPVEGFGRALLAGYGWPEGMGIGREAREDVKVVEFKSWSGKEGLGFAALNHPQNPGKLVQEGV